MKDKNNLTLNLNYKCPTINNFNLENSIEKI